MSNLSFPLSELEKEISFKTSRSGGKGGQNVNKVSTKVELNFDIGASKHLTDDQKKMLATKLKGRINKEGILQVIVQSERSQLKNKELATQKFRELIIAGFKKRKKRIATKMPASVKENILIQKKKQSEKKANRRIRE